MAPKKKVPRTREQLQEEYNKYACILGHKSRLLYQTQIQAVAAEKEVKALLEHLVALNEEGMKLPKPITTDTIQPLPAKGACL